MLWPPGAFGGLKKPSGVYSYDMAKTAGILLIIAFVLDVLAGLGYVMLGLMGAGMMAMLGAMLGEMANIAGGGAGAMAEVPKIAGSLGSVLGGVGLLIMVAGALALAAALRILKQRPGKIIYAGSAAAIIADAAPLILIGFNPFQLPGIVGGALGIVAAQKLGAADEPDAAKAGIEHREEAPPAAAIRSSSSPSRVPELLAGGSILIGLALIAFVAYLQFLRPGGPGPGAAPQATAPAQALPSTVGTTPHSPTPAAASPASTDTGQVDGQVAGWPFKPERVALETRTWTRLGDGGSRPARFEKLSLVFDHRKDLQVEVSDLPDDYDLETGLELRVTPDNQSFDLPKLTIKSPKSGSSFPNTDIVHNGYDLNLVLEPLDGNRVNGRITLGLAPDRKTRISGSFRAWVDGQLDIEPDLTRGGAGSFKYLVYQYLKDLHSGSTIAFEDSISSHQVGDASKRLTGSMSAIYTVDGKETAGTFRMATSDGCWQLVDSLAATQLPEANPVDPPDPDNERQWVRYLAAKRTEQWIQQAHPGKYPWVANHTGTTSVKVGYADIHLRLQFHGESDAIERRYYYRRENGEWRYIRELEKNEKLDRETGEILVD
jgi:hypothetical protein